MDPFETKEDSNADFSRFYDSPANVKTRIAAANKPHPTQFISSKTRQIVLVLILIVLAGMTAYMVITRPKSAKFVPPVGYEITYPKDGPPRLDKIK